MSRVYEKLRVTFTKLDMLVSLKYEDDLYKSMKLHCDDPETLFRRKTLSLG